MSTPATRSLEAVLRRALAPGEELRLVVGEFDDPPADARYANVVIDGAAPLQVPKPPAETAGKAAYMLAAPGRMLVLGAGTTGPTGPTGPAGAQGPQGPTGPAGAEGTAGATGSQGPKGDTGATGAQGTQGPQGISGASTFIAAAGAPTAGVGVDGAIYLDATSLRFWGPKAAGAWPAAAFARLVPLNPTYAQLRTG